MKKQINPSTSLRINGERSRTIKIRKAWAINPATRVKKSKKIYARQRLKEITKRMIANER